MNKKQTYQKPTMRVHEIHRRTQLLAGSNVNARMYGTFTEEDM